MRKQNMYENHWAILDGAAFLDKKTAHELIKKELSLPSYYGGNLDALYDCLTEMGPTEIDLFSCAMIRRNLDAYGDKLLQVFSDAAEANPDLTLKMFD